MRVRHLPSDPGPAAWNSILPRQKERPRLEESVEVDYLIIGAGFAGLSAAKRLLELSGNESVMVVDAGRIANGPAGRNSGFMIDVPHDLSSDDYGGNTNNDHRDVQLNRAGIEYALAIKEAYGMTDEAIQVGGKINGAITSRGVSHNDAYAKHLAALNESFERLSALDMQQLTGSKSYVDGLFTPGTAMLQPALYIRELAAGVERDGAKLYENSPILSLEKNKGRWLALSDKGQVRARKVILGVNGHLESFGFFQKHLMHVYTYGSMTKSMTTEQLDRLGGRSNWALTPADPLGTTVRRISGSGGDRLIIRNRATFDPSLKVSDSRLQAVGRTHDNSFKERFPQLDDVDMEYRWGGRLCLTRNNVPVFGRVDDGVYSACCQNGLGTAKGTISGKLAAELACGKSSDLLDLQSSYDRPSRLPPKPLASLGAFAVIRWGEFRAGKEL